MYISLTYLLTLPTLPTSLPTYLPPNFTILEIPVHNAFVCVNPAFALAAFFLLISSPFFFFLTTYVQYVFIYIIIG